MRKRYKLALIEIPLIFIGMFVIGFFIAGAIGDKLIDPKNIKSPIPIALSIVGVFIYIIFLASKYGKDYDGNGKKKKQADSQFFMGRLFTKRDLKENFIYCNYRDIKNQNFAKKRSKKGDSFFGAGVMVQNEYNKAKTSSEVCFVPPIHTMVIGNTNTGKSQAFILPSIQAYAAMPSKPTMIISDIKGELFRDCNKALQEQGYNCVTLNLYDPLRSDRWNPLEPAFRKYQRAQALKKEVYIHRSGTPKETKLQYDKNIKFDSIWWEFDGIAYATEPELEYAIEGKEQVLYAEISEDITDIINVIVPMSDPKDAMWVNGARGFAKAVLFSMLEDSKYPELGMTIEKFNFYNFFKIINIKDGGDAPYETLKKYFKNRSRVFNAQELANDVTNSSETTASSFLATLNPNITLFGDPGIAFLTSGTDINFASFVEKPTAFFIRIPDAKETMHKLATIAIEQLYKELTAIALVSEGLRLPRPTFFILDEFANLPVIQKMGTYVATSRSRWIYFILVLQDYTQLVTKYEKAGADTIKNNCNVHVFIGSGDLQTLKELSERSGKKVVSVEDKSVSRQDGKDEGKNIQKSKKDQERPLIFVEELQQLDKEKAVIFLDKTPAFYTTLNFFFRSRGVFNTEQTADSYRPIRYLNESKVWYDIRAYIEMQGGRNQGYTDFSGNGGGSGGKGKSMDSDLPSFDFNFDF